MLNVLEQEQFQTCDPSGKFSGHDELSATYSKVSAA